MSFVRPEAKAAAWRWRELLTGLGLVALGGWWIAGPGGLLGWIGWVLTIAGGAGIVIGLQRGRFRTLGGGAGVVQVDEGQIAYFGPLTGGALAIDQIDRLILTPESAPAHWQLESSDQTPLLIPVNAEGAEALFDVFSALPGLRTERMLSHLQKPLVHPVVIWERHPSKQDSRWLH